MFNQRVLFGCLRQLTLRNQARQAHKACETPPQYDVSEKMRKLFEVKQKQREATKAYFQKIIMNPHRPKQDTVPFDPVLFRYNALMTYNVEYFRPNLNNTLVFFGLYIFPLTIMIWAANYTKGNYERRLRAGEIAYRDRFNKGIL